jgi:hypothetical protein
MEGNQMKYSSEWYPKKSHGETRKMNWQHKFAETEILETEKIDSSPKSMNMT